MNQECIFKVGQRVCDCSYGWGEVVDINIDSDENYPIAVDFESGYSILFSCDGKENLELNRTLFFEEIPIPESALKPKRWGAPVGEAYYMLTSYFNICRDLDKRRDVDNSFYDSGNYFKTNEEAEQAFVKVKELLLSL